MGSLFRKPSLPPIPQVIEPEPADVPTAEDEARAIEEAAQMRKSRRSTILTEPDMEDEQVKLKKPLLGD
jgi:hypothetical protein